MSFMLALPKISLHGAGAIGDMVKLVAGKQWGKALIVTDGQLVKLGLLDSLFSALDEQQMAYQLFDEVFPNPTEALVQQGYAAYQAARCDYLIAFGGGGPHFCLGAQLARMEIQVLFEELVARVPRIELLGPPDRLRSNFIGGIKHLPVRFHPA